MSSFICPVCKSPSALRNSCPACGARYAGDPRVTAARRIKRATLALADRDAGIDTRTRRPLVDSLTALQAQLAARHDVGLRVVEQILDDVCPMLQLLADVRTIVLESKDGTALAWLDAFAEIRDVLYPDTDLARQLNERRAMTPEQIEAVRAASDAAEREAWAGVKHDPGAEDPPPAAPDNRIACDGCGNLFPAGDSYKLRTFGKLFAFEPGMFCPDCAAKHGRGELALPPRPV